MQDVDTSTGLQPHVRRPQRGSARRGVGSDVPGKRSGGDRTADASRMLHRFAAVIAAALFSAAAHAAESSRSELALMVGRATDSDDTDIVRLAYRRPLAVAGDAFRPWWQPRYIQFGASVWRLPDLGGTTRRYDANVTPVWRREAARGYLEAGIGVYLLSSTINNDTHQLPSTLQFGSHVGAGLRLQAASPPAWRFSIYRTPASSSRTAASTSTWRRWPSHCRRRRRAQRPRSNSTAWAILPALDLCDLGRQLCCDSSTEASATLAVAIRLAAADIRRPAATVILNSP
jgi:Lipid A 3-O-deacylase (PagL)